MHLSVKPHFNSTLLSNRHTHQFALEGFPGFSRRRVGTRFMPWHFPQLKNDTGLCLFLHGRRLCSSSSNDIDPEETEEIWSFRNLILWAFEHCILSHNISFCVLREFFTSTYLCFLGKGCYLESLQLRISLMVVRFYIAPAPAKMGYAASVQRFLKVMAMVWAGSQITKLVRAGGALALAPFVDRGLSWFTNKFKFQSQGRAFMAIVGFCLGLALIVFLVITLLWA
ncbi:hypothetical protein Fmac_011746 [Flemingia macrophylla]|uniref:Uncharacterized protein n=1 Tax=Flemingia macrophylla TaxID=520843 RepID=A0ABD1MNB9_9FABA